MAAPKRRTSKMKSRSRRGANRWRKPLLKSCPECETKIPGHIACPSCGFYHGRQVLNIEA